MPKFKIGDIVTKGTLKKKHQQAYHIYDNPSWNDEYRCWSYPYDYGLGLTSEGFGLESHLVIVPLSKKKWIFL